jgi:aarF domain-containing kinase
MLRNYARQYRREISTLLRRIPRELLLLLKTNDCLRSIDACLGRPLNTISITARECSVALSVIKAKHNSGSLRGRVRAWIDKGLIEVQIAKLHIFSVVERLCGYFGHRVSACS